MKVGRDAAGVSRVGVDELLTTREVAALLGVGTSSVKRWADRGVLASVRTPGGHRRVPRSALAALRAPGAAGAPVLPQAAPHGWLERLAGTGSVAELVAALRSERALRGSWAAACDVVGEGLGALGRAWLAGELTILEEHVASDKLERALVLVGQELRVPGDAPTWLLMTAPGDDHALGLRLVELCLRELGVRAIWSGRRTPAGEAVALVSRGSVTGVAVSASEGSGDAELLARFAAQLGRACAERAALFVLGGRGAWPEPPPFGVRLRHFAELAALLAPTRPRPARKAPPRARR
ncbi:MAG: helix-turn-helix domain-containing protein [Myxococcales bacterium]|nr:helix-turn-helix domain-containing protein [Myxococcales bacterium]